MIHLSAEAFLFSFFPFLSLFLSLLKLSRLSLLFAFIQCLIIYLRDFSLDTLSYLDIYHDPIPYEIGFRYFTLFIKYIGFSELNYILIIPILQLAILFIILKYSRLRLNPSLFIAVWICTFWFLSYGTNAIRQGFAAIFIFYAILNYENKRTASIFAFILALSFHWSAFIIIILYSLRNFFDYFSKNNFLFLLIAIILVIGTSLLNTTAILNNLFPNVAVGELSSERTSPIFRWCLNFIFLTIYIYYKKYIISDYLFNYINVLKVYKTYFLFLTLLIGSNEAFSRLNAYTWLLDCFLISCILSSFKISDKNSHVIFLFSSSIIGPLLGYSNITAGRLLGIISFNY
jgi:hypothetical protein